jgi:hypothetical protein
MVWFDIQGALHEYSERFDLDDYKIHRIRHIAYLLGNKHEYDYGFIQQMLTAAKQKNYHIPVRSRVLAFFYYQPKDFLKRKLKNSALVRKLYYRLNLDVRQYGEDALFLRHRPS